MSDALLIWAVGVGLVLAAVAPFVRARRRRERRARETAERAERAGLHQPASLHPVVDPARCLGCGACTAVCPEGDVLALVGGQAATVAPARCVGHGRCERACPTDAITLVFGTAERGVDLPRVRGDYMTNVEGLYIVGELGGMGLVRNAVEQGRQCAEGIARAVRAQGASAQSASAEGAFDAVVVGAGPAGLSAAATLAAGGVRYVVLERAAELGGTVRHYPRRKLVLTQPFELPGYGRLSAVEIEKEALVGIWREAAEASGVAAHLRAGHRVTAIRRALGGAFEVESEGRPTVRARRVVLAIGRRGTPRRLGIPGEDQAHVVYALTEPEAYRERACLVVGGGDSAVEAAVALADAGARVRLSYRRTQITRARAANVARLAEAVAAGAVEPLWSTTPEEIGPDWVRLATPAGALRVPADDVLVFVGGELPGPFLERCGVVLDAHFGVPRIDGSPRRVRDDPKGR